MHEEMLRKTFDKYDKDKSGAISTRELREFMQEIMGEKVRSHRAATPPPTTQKRVAKSCTEVLVVSPSLSLPEGSAPRPAVSRSQ